MYFQSDGIFVFKLCKSFIGPLGNETFLLLLLRLFLIFVCVFSLSSFLCFSFTIKPMKINHVSFEKQKQVCLYSSTPNSRANSEISDIKYSEISDISYIEGMKRRQPGHSLNSLVSLFLRKHTKNLTVQ